MIANLGYWYSILPISSELIEKLNKCGISEQILKINKITQKTLVFYSTPDEIIEYYLTNNNNDKNSLEQIINIYGEIIKHRYENNISLIPLWQLNRLNADQLEIFLKKISENKSFNEENLANLKRSTPSKIYIYLTQQISKKYPNWINDYLDLELNACLINQKIDLNYKEFLIQNSLKEDELIDNYKSLYQSHLNLNFLSKQNNDSLNELEKIKIYLTKKLETLEFDRKELTNKYDKKEIQLVELKNEKSKYESELNLLKKEKNDLIVEKNLLQEKFEAELENSNIKLTKQEIQLGELKNEKSKYESELNLLKKEKDDLIIKKNLLQEKFEAELENSNTKLTKQEIELVELKNEYLFYNNELNIIQKENDDLLKEKIFLKDKLDQAEKKWNIKIQQKDSEIFNCKLQETKNNNEIILLKKEKDDLIVEKKLLQEKFDNEVKENKIQLLNLKNDREKLLNKSDKQETEIVELKNEELYYSKEINQIQDETEKYYKLLCYYKGILDLQEFELDRSFSLLEKFSNKMKNKLGFKQQSFKKIN